MDIPANTITGGTLVVRHAEGAHRAELDAGQVLAALGALRAAPPPAAVDREAEWARRGELDARAWEMRVAGATLKAVAEALGTTRWGATQAIAREAARRGEDPPRGQRVARVTAEGAARAYELRLSGMTYDGIARELGAPQSTVYRAVRGEAARRGERA